MIPFVLCYTPQVSVTSPAWTLDAELNGLTGCDCPDVHGVYGLTELISHAFEIALIQYFTYFKVYRIYLFDRGITPRAVCPDDVLQPVNMGRLKSFTTAHLWRVTKTLPPSKNSLEKLLHLR